MSINQRQYEQLTEMGISLWQQKFFANTLNSATEDHSEQETSAIAYSYNDLTTLTKDTVFTDILHILELSIGEISLEEDHIDLGLFNWFFQSNKAITTSISCHDNNLISPTLEVIRQSPELKKSLWQIIIKHLL